MADFHFRTVGLRPTPRVRHVPARSVGSSMLLNRAANSRYRPTKDIGLAPMRTYKYGKADVQMMVAIDIAANAAGHWRNELCALTSAAKFARICKAANSW